MTLNQAKWPLVISPNLNVWLKHPLKNKNSIGLGFSGSLPAYKVKAFKYMVIDTKNTESIKSGFGYFSIALTYSFNTQLKKGLSKLKEANKNMKNKVIIDIN